MSEFEFVNENNLDEDQAFFDYPETDYGDFSAKIKVIGAGGGGGNAVSTMVEEKIEGVEFIVANTDAQALKASTVPRKLQLGKRRTRGLGAGGKPEIGKLAAQDDEEAIREELEGANMVFVTAGMGGGTGTGSAPVIAAIAKETGALTVGVVTKPFAFEGKKRMKYAEEGLAEFAKNVDTLLVIPNQQLLSFVQRHTSALETFAIADSVLCQAVKGISEIITGHGLINVDFADVKSVMSQQGLVLMGAGSASGENRAIEAAQNAINSPLLEDSSIDGAQGLLINVTGRSDMTMHEINDAASYITEFADSEADVYFGAVFDDSRGDEISVTVIATGFNSAQRAKRISEGNDAGQIITKPRREEIKNGVKDKLNFGILEGGNDTDEGVARPTSSTRILKTVNGHNPTDFAEDLDIPTYLRRHID